MFNLFFIGLVVTQQALADSSLVIRDNCLPQVTSDTVYSDDFKWNIELPDMLKLYKELYESDKRLAKRAYLDPLTSAIMLPQPDFRGGDIKAPLQFIETVKNHIENALRHEYIDAVFFPDMGHSHLLIPLKKWEKHYKDIPIEKVNEFYQQIFSDSDIKFIYHTAEQLKQTDENGRLLESKKLQWRYYTRNLVGENTKAGHVSVLPALQNKANTISEVNGYYWYGAGFTLHANKKGCFTFEHDGKSFNFDLSMYDSEPRN